eukprot:11607041-Ditylum_brightwellii.AAC.1
MAVSQGASASKPGCLIWCISDQQVEQGTWCLPASQTLQSQMLQRRVEGGCPHVTVHGEKYQKQSRRASSLGPGVVL